MKYTILMQLGDPSKDGHNEHEDFYFKSNKSRQVIEEAYKKCCEKTGLVFTSNTDVVVDGQKLNWQHPEYKDRCICIDYEDSHLSDLAVNILKSFNIDVDKYVDTSYQNYIEAGNLICLFLEFIKIELPDFEYEFTSIDSEILNITIGYGCYGN